MKLASKNAPSSLAGSGALIRMFVLCIAFASACLMTSCQTGWRDNLGYWHPGNVPAAAPNWATDQCAGQTSYGLKAPASFQVPSVMYYRVPPPASASQKSATINGKKAAKSASVAPRPHAKISSLPPAGPPHVYNAVWDSRPRAESKDGYYLMTNSHGKHWKLKPTQFHPFNADHVHRWQMAIYNSRR